MTSLITTLFLGIDSTFNKILICNLLISLHDVCFIIFNYFDLVLIITWFHHLCMFRHPVANSIHNFAWSTPFCHNSCKDQKYPPLVLAQVRLKFEQNLQCLVSSCKDCFPLKGVCKLVGKILTMPLSCIALAQKVSFLS